MLCLMQKQKEKQVYDILMMVGSNFIVTYLTHLRQSFDLIRHISMAVHWCVGDVM